MVVGAGGAQLLGWASTPILTRLYGPSDWGTFGLMISMASVIGIFSGLRYEFALFLPRLDKHAQQLVTLCFFVSTLFFIFNMILFFIFRKEMEEFIFSENLGNWLLIVPFIGLMICWTNVLSNSASRQSKFSVLSLSLALQQFSNFLVALILGLLSPGFVGLLLAKLLGLLFYLWSLSQRLSAIPAMLPNKGIYIRLLFLAKKYQRFPKYSLSNSLLSIVSKDGILYMIAFFSDVKMLGFLIFSRTLIFAPASLMSSILGPIFLKEFSLNQKLALNNRRALYFYLLILVTGLPLYLYMGWNAEFLIVQFFGPLWGGAGKIFSFLIPAGFLLLYTSWVDRIFEIKQRTDLALIIQIFFDVVMLCSLIYFTFNNFTFEAICIFYAVVLFTHNLVYFSVASFLIFYKQL